MTGPKGTEKTCLEAPKKKKSSTVRCSLGSTVESPSFRLRLLYSSRMGNKPCVRSEVSTLEIRINKRGMDKEAKMIWGPMGEEYLLREMEVRINNQK